MLGYWGKDASNSPSTLLNGLIHRWSFDEASGTRVDSVDSADLSDNNTVGSDVGMHNSAASLVAGNIETLTKSGIDLGLTTAASWVMWLKPTVDGAYHVPLAKWNHGTATEWAIEIQPTTGQVLIYVAEAPNSGGGNSVITTEALTSNVWQSVIITYDGSLSAPNRIAIYLDGLAATLTVSGTIAASLQHTTGPELTFGNFSSASLSRYYTGLIDEPLIYNRVLTTDEIALLYNSGAGNFWPFTGLP